jgi:hypothetical protein
VPGDGIPQRDACASASGGQCQAVRAESETAKVIGVAVAGERMTKVAGYWVSQPHRAICGTGEGAIDTERYRLGAAVQGHPKWSRDDELRCDR